jgi:PPP family 3-phenylpropionic acid transporter
VTASCWSNRVAGPSFRKSTDSFARRGAPSGLRLALGRQPFKAEQNGTFGESQFARFDRHIHPTTETLFQALRFRMMILVTSSVYGSHAMHDAFAVIWWSAAGIEPWTISILWSEAVAAEVIVFFLIGPALLDRLGPWGAAVLAAAAGVVRWSVAGVTTSVLALSIIQPLHGFTFALLHLASMRMMQTLVPARLAGTGQSIYAFGPGCLTAVLTLISGILYAKFGGAAFLPMAILCAVALPLAWLGFADERHRSVDIF